jgi:hypothetical protein
LFEASFETETGRFRFEPDRSITKNPGSNAWVFYCLFARRVGRADEPRVERDFFTTRAHFSFIRSLAMVYHYKSFKTQ